MIHPDVAVIFENEHDLMWLDELFKHLRKLHICYIGRLIAFHLDPEYVKDFAFEAESRKVQVIIAACGESGHLPGIMASNTCIPVIGLPLYNEEKTILAMTKTSQGCPVAVMGAGAFENAAIFVHKILFRNRDFREYERMTEKREEAKRKRLRLQQSNEFIIDSVHEVPPYTKLETDDRLRQILLEWNDSRKQKHMNGENLYEKLKSKMYNEPFLCNDYTYHLDGYLKRMTSQNLKYSCIMKKTDMEGVFRFHVNPKDQNYLVVLNTLGLAMLFADMVNNTVVGTKLENGNIQTVYGTAYEAGENIYLMPFSVVGREHY